MGLSAPFIHRPVGTSLLMMGVLLLGLVAYRALGVAALPSVDLPTIRVYGYLPGASPQTMAASVATPLERQLGQIADVTQLTSTNALGSTEIGIQFALGRDINGAARDVQAAINAAGADLPKDMPGPPIYRKSNPAAYPVIQLALVSDALPGGTVFDYADTVVAQKLSQLPGVAEVLVWGAGKSAVRVRADPAALAAMGLSLEDLRTALAASTAAGPTGSLDGDRLSWTLAANDQLSRAEQYRRVIVAWKNGAAVRVGDVATVTDDVTNRRSAAWYNDHRAVMVAVIREQDANIVEVVDAVHAALPQLSHWIPPAIRIAPVSDRSATIRAGIADVQVTLLLTAALVVLVILVFLRRFWATAIPSATIPVALAGTAALMWACRYTLDNLSMMALTVAIGFVVDDAIVMIENIARHVDAGEPPLAAALKGARQIGFTVVSITASLVAAFIPLLFMAGVTGRFFREFSVTLSGAIVISAAVSLTLTPGLCGRFLTRAEPGTGILPLRLCERGFQALQRAYAASLAWCLDRRPLMLAVTLAAMAGSVHLYGSLPKGFVPPQDTGLIWGSVEGPQDISFPAMAERQQALARLILADPAVESLGAYLPDGAGSAVNDGGMLIRLKPRDQRRMSVTAVIDRLRDRTRRLSGIAVYMQPIYDFGFGARRGKALYQYTLRDPDVAELDHWTGLVEARLRQMPELRDVALDRKTAGLQAALTIDRDAAARLGVSPAAIDNTLYDSFGQRQVATYYRSFNSFKVVLEADPGLAPGVEALDRIRVKSTSGAMVPLGAFTRMQPANSTLAVAHQGQVPAVTISFNLAPGVSIRQATDRIDRAMDAWQLPEGLRASFEGNARGYRSAIDSQPLLILAAVAMVYLVLGILYESLIHPVTILSTLPSAGLGALLALDAAGAELTLIALIGIILLIGIVKKNAILMIDFAIDVERRERKSPREAIFQAAMLRFRPIMMTTMAAALGAVPLALGLGEGAELRRPLGISIVGGLLVSQLLTLYTTPVIYLYLDQLQFLKRRRRERDLRDPSPVTVPR